MNKKTLIFITALVVLCSAILLFLVSKILFPEKKIVFDQTNRTFVVKGGVSIKKAEETAPWQKMTASTVVAKGDIIQTDKDSTVDIIIGENMDKAVRVGEDSHVEVQEVNPARLDLSKGKIMVSLKKLEPKSSFVVKTPTAICGARGTAWLEKATQDKTSIYVFENDVFIQEVDTKGVPKRKKYIASAGTERTLAKDEPISEAQNIGADELEEWKSWSKNITFLRDGKILINDFNKKENFNNLGGEFGSWVVFYTDTNQHCRDEFSLADKVGEGGYGLKLDYDVDSPFSAYNGFFTKLMGIDLTGYHYLVFSIKGDKKAGFTTRLNVELKNKFEIGKITVKGITDEWQKVVLPFGKFAGIKDFQDMKELVIVFDDLNATQKEGVVYIDDIYFTKEEPKNS